MRCGRPRETNENTASRPFFLTVSIAIQAHPRRAILAEGLRDCFQGRAEVVYDPEPDTSPSAWRCYREALLRTPTEATHRLIVQEDALICDGFTETVEIIAGLVPDRPVCLFVGGQAYPHVRATTLALADGRRWITLSNQTWIPVVATLWPAVLVGPLVEWVDRQFERIWPPGFTADDEICGRYLHEKGIVALATVPSLVEHPDTEDSLVRRQVSGGLDPARRAAVWIGDLGICDARDLDWAAPPGI